MQKLAQNCANRRKPGGSGTLKRLSELNRREFLKLTASTTAAISCLPCAQAASLPLQPERLRANLGSPDGISIWWLRGTRYAKTADATIPLHDVEQAIFAKLINDVGAPPAIVLSTLTCCTDMHRYGMQQVLHNSLLGSRNLFRHERIDPGIYRARGPGRCDNSSDRLIVTELYADDVLLEFLPSLATATSKSAEIEFAPMNRLHCRQNVIASHTRSAWPEGPQIDNHPGYMLTCSIGRKLGKSEQLPPAFLAFARRVYPWLIRDPSSWLNDKVRFMQALT